MIETALRAFLADAGRRPPTAHDWSQLLAAAGLETQAAQAVPQRLGVPELPAGCDASAVREQLDSWADASRRLGEHDVADRLAAAAAAVLLADVPDAGRPPPGQDDDRRDGSPEPVAPSADDAPGLAAAGSAAAGSAAAGVAAAGRPRSPRPPSPPPGRRAGPLSDGGARRVADRGTDRSEGGPGRGNAAQPPRRRDPTRPQAPQPPGPDDGDGADSDRLPDGVGRRRSPVAPGSALPRSQGGAGDAAVSVASHDAGASQAVADSPPPAPLPRATKAVLAVLVMLLLACLVGLAVTVLGR